MSAIVTFIAMPLNDYTNNGRVSSSQPDVFNREAHIRRDHETTSKKDTLDAFALFAGEMRDTGKPWHVSMRFKSGRRPAGFKSIESATVMPNRFLAGMDASLLRVEGDKQALEYRLFFQPGTADALSYAQARLFAKRFGSISEDVTLVPTVAADGSFLHTVKARLPA